MSLGKKFILSLICIIILPTLALNQLFVQKVNEEIESSLFAKLTSIAEFKIQRIEHYFDEREIDIQEAQHYKNIKVNLPLLDTFIDTPHYPLFLAAEKSLDSQLQPFQKIKNILDLMLVNTRGIVLYSTNPRHKIEELGQPLHDPSGQIMTRGREGFFIAPISLDDQSGHGVEMLTAGPLHNDSGELIGLVVIELDPEQIYEIARDTTGLGETGETLIGKRLGDRVMFFITHRHAPTTSRPKIGTFDSQSFQPMQLAVRGQDGAGQAVDYRDHEVMAVWRHIPSREWGLVAKIDIDEALASVYKLRIMAWAVALSILGLAGFMALFITRQFITPLARLEEGARQLGHGELGYRFDHQKNNEIGRLGQAFNAMAEDLADSYATMEDEVVKRTAELEVSRQNALTLMQEANQERQRAQEALSHLKVSHQEVSRLSQVVEQAPLSIIIADLDGIIEYVNPHTLEVTGYTHQELIGAHTRIFGSGQLSGEFYQNLWQTILAGKVWHGEFCNKKKGGEIFWELASISPVFDQQGRIINFFALKEDITLQRKAQKELASMAHFADDNPAPVFRMDDQSLIILANEATEKLFQSDDLINKPLSPHCPFLTPAEQRQLIETNSVSQHECLIHDHHILFTFKGNRADQTINAYGTDISTLKQTEQNLQQRVKDLAEMRHSMLNMMEDLEHSTRAAQASAQAKSDFLANMSHEIRTPMNAILGMTYLAQQTRVSPQQQDYLDKISGAGKALLGIINDILDFSKIEAGKLEIEAVDFELDRTLTKVNDLSCQLAAEKEIELLISVDPDLPLYFTGDPLRLGQVLTNLMNNAIKFTEKGEITLSVDCLERDDQLATLRFAIKDSGIGMTPEQVGRLFQAFSQADSSTTRQYGGTGLGLSICKQLVELMGGKISVKSQPGQGSTFFFTLSLAIPAGKREQQMIPNDLVGLRALAVDDNPTAQEIMYKVLVSLGLRPSMAGSGPEALEMIDQAATSNAPYELIFMDYHLGPEMNGLEASRLIRQNNRLETIPPIIMVTGHDRDEIRRQTGKDELAGFLGKPFTPSTLLNTILPLFSHNNGSQIAALATDTPGRKQLQDLPGAMILLVEDNQINQQVARELLVQAGLTVDIANNGLEAVAAVQNKTYDLILMDLQMPEMDGFAASHEIRALEADTGSTTTPVSQPIPIIAMTAHAMTGDREKCLAAGMDDHISKPINPEIMYTTIARWLKQTRQDATDSAGNTPRPMAPATGEKRQAMTDRQDAMSLPDETFPEQLEGFSLEDGLRRLGQNKGLYLQLLRQFSQDHLQTHLRLQETFSDNDLESLGQMVHSLKGVSGNLGARNLYQSCIDLEQAIKDFGTRETLEHQLNQVTAHLTTALNSIAGLGLEGKPGTGAEEAIDRKALIALFEELAILLTRNSPDAIDHLTSITARTRDCSWMPALKELDAQVQAYDFDQATVTLQQIIITLSSELGSESDQP